MSTTAPALLDDPGDLSALRAKGGDADELFASFAAWAEAQGGQVAGIVEKGDGCGGHREDKRA